MNFPAGIKKWGYMMISAVLRLIDHAPYPFLRAVKKHRLSLNNPPKTVEEHLATLEKQGLAKAVAFLRQHKDSI